MADQVATVLAYFDQNGLGEVVGVGLGVVFQNLRRFETVDAAPVAVDQVGEVVDIDAQRDRVALAVDIDVEILREAEIQRVIPRHHSPPPAWSTRRRARTGSCLSG